MANPTPLDGLLLIDKPADMTSHDVVHHLRRALGQKSIGHTGTLDPIATGLMIVVLGEATKLSDYLVMKDKSYRFTVRLGITTDTLDRTGQVLTETPFAVPDSKVRDVALGMSGEFEWPIPLFSAAKIDGKKLYEYGREGEAVELPRKVMEFWDVQLEEQAGPMLQLSLKCSKGSFIRTWAAQLGEVLGVGGRIEELRRLSVGHFNVNEALPLSQLMERGGPGGIPVAELGAAFIPMSDALPELKSLMAGQKEARLMANGQIPRDLQNRLVFEQKQAFERGAPVFVKVMSNEGSLLAILAALPGQGLKIRRVFQNALQK